MDSREARRRAFIARHQKSIQKNEGGGLGFFKQNLEGVKFWKCGKGDHELDIIEYVAGPNDPDVKEGEITHVLEVYEHRDVGDIEGQSFICLEKTYQKPCPICEYRKQLAKSPEASEEVIKALRPNRYPRTIYNVVVYDSAAEEEKGVQVWHTSAFLFGQHIDKLAKSSPRDIRRGEPELKMYSSPDEDGYSIQFSREGDGISTKYMAHQLVPRPDPIPQEYLDQAHQLDQLIYIPTYEEVYAAFWGEDADSKALERSTGQKSTHSAKEQTGASRSSRSSRKAQTENKPSTRGRSTSRKTKPEPETDDFGPEDELPESLKSKSDNGEHVCPAGGVFGEDAYELEQCDTCDLWEPCYKLNQDLVAEDGAAHIADEEEVQEDLPPVEEPPKRAPRAARSRKAASAKTDEGSNGRRARRSATEDNERPARAAGRSSRRASPPSRTRTAGRARGRGLVR